MTTYYAHACLRVFAVGSVISALQVDGSHESTIDVGALLAKANVPSTSAITLAGLAFAKDGTLYVVDTGNQRVWRILGRSL